MPTAESQSVAVTEDGAGLRSEVLGVAQGMLEQAHEREWQTVSALHARLGRLLYKMLSNPPANELNETRTTLETVMKIAQSVSTLASDERLKTLQKLQHHRGCRAAADHYQRQGT